MTFISYAQNYEDVMLRRALRDVKNGFYVDVGAEHPINDSVTMAFYEEGWSGVNIEPVPSWYQLICENRPRDINLNIAVGDTPGTLTLYSVEGTGLSTADPRFVEEYRKEGRNVSALDVPVRTLTDVLEQHARTEIHFLKIDVEGFERQVIEGLDLHRYRPWVLVIESTLPNSREERYADWEPLITSCGYDFAYFDGLNRFYVAAEKMELAERFSVPPNHFDGFIRRSEWEWRERAVALREKLVTVQSALEATSYQIDEIKHQRALRERQVQDLMTESQQREHVLNKERQLLLQQRESLNHALEVTLASSSWKITAPLRWFKAFARELPRMLSTNRGMRFLGTLLLKPFPGTKRKLVRVIVGAEPPSTGETVSPVREGIPAGEAASAFLEKRDAVLARSEEKERV